MHANQLSSSPELVKQLLREQLPQWAELPVVRVRSDGTANAIYRLGDDMAVRLPYVASDAKTTQIQKENTWLPRFAPDLPLALPVPLALAEPSDRYPCPWMVCRWIEGEDAAFDRLADPIAEAETLAAFVSALQQIDAGSGPPPGDHNFLRGVPLADRDAQMRATIPRCEGLVDIERVAAAWELDLNAPLWSRPPVWLHGDLAPGNMLARDGRLVAVIDWGGLGVGDPAIELLPAWNLFEGASREAYRRALGVDDATWARGRGLALMMGVIALPYYLETNPAVVRWARRIIAEVLADHDRGAALL